MKQKKVVGSGMDKAYVGPSICRICTRRTSDWHGNALTLSLIGYTSTCEIAVRNSDWLHRLFHMRK